MKRGTERRRSDTERERHIIIQIQTVKPRGRKSEGWNRKRRNTER